MRKGAIQTFAVGLLIYVASCVIFERSHTRAGSIRKGGFTTIYLALDDTPLNRALLTFYTPLRSLRFFDLPVVWD